MTKITKIDIYLRKELFYLGMLALNIKAVIFDLDGPILDSFREGLRRIKIVCAVYNIPFEPEHHKKLTELWGTPGVELLVQGLGLSEESAKSVIYPAWERLDLSQPVPLVPRAREVLSWLRRNKIPATILTSRHREHVLNMLERIDLDQYFSVVSTKFDTPYRKPDPRVFYYTLEELKDKFGIAKDECIFVGDTPADVDAEQAAMIETLLVQTGPYLLKHADKLPLSLANILNSIDDLPGWIEEHQDSSSFLPYD